MWRVPLKTAFFRVWDRFSIFRKFAVGVENCVWERCRKSWKSEFLEVLLPIDRWLSKRFGAEQNLAYRKLMTRARAFALARFFLMKQKFIHIEETKRHLPYPVVLSPLCYERRKSIRKLNNTLRKMRASLSLSAASTVHRTVELLIHHGYPFALRCWSTKAKWFATVLKHLVVIASG